MRQAGLKIYTVFLAAFLVAQSGILLAEDQMAQDSGIRKYGVVHNIADDRKVEKVGGIYEPEGLDKYLQRRLDDVTARLDEFSEKLNKIDQKLESLSLQSRTASDGDHS